MDSTFGLIASLLLNIGLLLIVFGQSKKIQVERQKNEVLLTVVVKIVVAYCSHPRLAI